jgi:serine/threonine protein kinase
LCHQNNLEEIKYIHPYLVCKDPYLKSALDSEIQILSKIKSSNIVGFFDVLMSSHNYYIIQELCEGDLENYLEKNKKKIAEDQAIKFLTEICNGFMTLVK